jgi:hypothetical protein
MDSVLDDVARVLASPIGRREAFARISKLLAGAVLAGVIGETKAVRAQNQNQNQNENDKKKSKCKAPTVACGSGGDDDNEEKQICCPPGTCCNHGEDSSKCCQKGQCMCEDGRCASSMGGRCPEDCRKC